MKLSAPKQRRDKLEINWCVFLSQKELESIRFLGIDGERWRKGLMQAWFSLLQTF